MDDRRIIELFFARDEQAIAETRDKYSGLIKRIAVNLLGNSADADECVNDALLAVWNNIPPARPDSLKAYLGGIARNKALMSFRRRTAKKRSNGLELSLSELDECVPSPNNAEESADLDELAGLLNDWLRSLPERDSMLFIRRYWYGDSVKELSKETGESANRLSQRLFYLRKKLREFLDERGVTV